MSSKGSQICKLLLILAMSLTWVGSRAQSSSTSCTSVLISMSSCLNYITGNSSTPASSCCSALANVVQSQPQCLCAALNSNAASSLGVAINQTRAVELPSSCNVQTPPLSKCNGGGSNAGVAPTDSPTRVPNEQPENPSADFPSGSGSKTVPENASNGNIVKSCFHFLAYIVSCTTLLAMF